MKMCEEHLLTLGRTLSRLRGEPSLASSHCHDHVCACDLRELKSMYDEDDGDGDGDSIHTILLGRGRYVEKNAFSPLSPFLNDA